MLRDRTWHARSTDTFTLQWHLTDACENECRHCYREGRRSILSAADAHRVLEELARFSQRHRVLTHLCLSGGNPLLYPHFFEIYAAAARQVHRISILGNPIDEADLAAIVAIRRPASYQVSLEGLAEHNDSIRGTGHHERTRQFLALLRKHRVHSHVMLTLTRDNCSEVLALAEQLRSEVDRFTFNRLSQVGAGGLLAPCEPDRLQDFYSQYLAQLQSNPILRLKDNLLVPLWLQGHRRSFGGCTGHGCGAAFSFLALLPNGELHACRKFPSRIGHILEDGLESSYASRAAARYRGGSKGCRSCRHRSACGGCMAVTYGRALDPLRDRDPDCRW